MTEYLNVTMAGEHAFGYLESHPLPKRLKILPRRFRRQGAYSFARHRAKLSGETLHAQIKSDLREAGAIPSWLIGILINIAIKALMGLLEKWWQKRNLDSTGGA